MPNQHLDSAPTPDNTRSSMMDGCDRCRDAFALGARFCPACGSAAELIVPTSRRHEVEPVPARPPGTPVSPTEPSSAIVEADMEDVAQPNEAELSQPTTRHAECAAHQEVQDDAAAALDTSAACCDGRCPHCGAALKNADTARFRLITMGSQDVGAISLPSEKPVIIGSDEACDLVISHDSYVSRRHVRVGVDDNLVFATDLGSSNGTLLRIRRPIVLEPGDELILGSTVIRLELT